MGVIGGGGVSGGGGVISGLLNGEGGRFPVARVERFGRRDRCVERRPGDEEFEEGSRSWRDRCRLDGRESPAARRILPRSEPYAGGGARVPTLGAKPHFLTFASIKTNPA